MVTLRDPKTLMYLNVNPKKSKGALSTLIQNLRGILRNNIPQISLKVGKTTKKGNARCKETKKETLEARKQKKITRSRDDDS